MFTDPIWSKKEKEKKAQSCEENNGDGRINLWRDTNQRCFFVWPIIKKCKITKIIQCLNPEYDTILLFQACPLQVPSDTYQSLSSGSIQDSFLCDVTVSSVFLLFFVAFIALHIKSLPSFQNISVYILEGIAVNKKQLHWHSGRARTETERSCKLLSQILLWLFLLTNTELVKVSAARAWASLHWHRFKRALPFSEKAVGTSLWENAGSLHSLPPPSLSEPVTTLRTLFPSLTVMPACGSSAVKASVHLLGICGRLGGEAGLYHSHTCTVRTHRE